MTTMQRTRDQDEAAIAAAADRDKPAFSVPPTVYATFGLREGP